MNYPYFSGDELGGAEIHEDGKIQIFTPGECPIFADEAAAREWIDEYKLEAQEIEIGPASPKEAEEKFFWHEISVQVDNSLETALRSLRRDRDKEKLS